MFFGHALYDNSTWMLAQRKDGMTQEVKRENKGMHAPVMKSLGFAMGDLQQSHRSRISQERVHRSRHTRTPVAMNENFDPLAALYKDMIPTPEPPTTF